MLIDAGNNADGELLVQYIKKLGISKIDYVIGTHAHEDHIGGLDDIIRAFDVDVIYMPAVSEKVSTETYKQVQEAIYNKMQEDKTLVVENPKINTTFSIGDAECIVKFVDNNDPENINNSSIVIEMTAEQEKYLFMGDSEKEVEEGELNNITWDDIDVLKVGHHGSNTSTTQKFIDTVLPEIAIISVRKK
jgi:competence protein ComEC